MTGGERVECPLCGEPCTLASWETQVDGLTLAVVMTDLGTWWPHLQAAHADEFATACRRQEAMNRSPATFMPRTVYGTFLRPGKGVGEL